MLSLTDLDLECNPKIEALAQQLRRVVDDIVGSGADFREREIVTLAVSNEVSRQDLQSTLQEIADSHGAEIAIDGQPHRVHEGGTVSYHSLCGGLRVTRSTYRPIGIRNAPTVVPMELEAGVVHRCTPALAKGLALAYARHDMRCHHESLRAAHRLPPSRTTLENVAKKIAADARAVAPKIEPYLRRSESLPTEANGIVLGLDRCAVAMTEQRNDDAANAPQKRRRRPYVRTPPPPIEVVWRMPYVGTFSVVDSNGEALVTRSYTATAAQGASRVVSQLMADVRASLQEDASLTVCIMQDGAPELWNLLRAALESESSVDNWCEGIDKYHLLERLAAALELVEPDGGARQWWLTYWSRRLDEHDVEIHTVEHHLVKRYRSAQGTVASKLWEHLVYIRNNKDRMRYASLIKAGLPVGSGVTEGAAKSVIGMRAKGSGRRWSEQGLRGVLTLRASYCSGRFEGLWRHQSRRYTARVEEAA